MTHTQTSGPRVGRRRRPTVVRRTALTASIMVVSWLAAGCGSDDDSTSASTATSAGSTETTAAAASTDAPESTEGTSQSTEGTSQSTEGTTTASDAATTVSSDSASSSTCKQGGDIGVGLESGFQTLDPATDIRIAANFTPALAIYDRLMTTSADGTVTPELAESLESDDGVTWVMKLREGIVFHDGTAFDAAAVKAHFDRLQNPDTGYPFAAQLDIIQAVTGVDDTTIEFVLASPWSSFPAFLSVGSPALVPSPAAIEKFGADYGRNPVGAGPFKVSEFVPDDHITLVRNEDYYRDGLPYLDMVTFRPIVDSQARLAAAQTGDVDITASFATDDFAAAEDAGLTVLPQQTTFYNVTYFNTTRPPFDDVRVRRALALGVDNDVINDVVYGGLRETMDGPLVNDHPYHIDLEYPGADPDTAQQLIDEYEAETGTDVSFKLTVFGSPEFQQAWTIIQQMWGDIGVEAEIETLDQPTLVANVTKGDYDAVSYRASVGPIADLNLFPAFHTGSPLNVSGISDPRLDSMLEQARVTLDDDEREALYADVQEVIAELVPAKYHTREQFAYFVNQRIENFGGADAISAAGVFLTTEICTAS